MKARLFTLAAGPKPRAGGYCIQRETRQKRASFGVCRGRIPHQRGESQGPPAPRCIGRQPDVQRLCLRIGSGVPHAETAAEGECVLKDEIGLEY